MGACRSGYRYSTRWLFYQCAHALWRLCWEIFFVSFNFYIWGQGQFFSCGQSYCLRRKRFDIISPFGQTKNSAIYHFYICTGIERYQYHSIRSFVEFLLLEHYIPFLYTHTSMHNFLLLFQYVQDFYFVFSVRTNCFFPKSSFIVIVTKPTSFSYYQVANYFTFTSKTSNSHFF